ncbi:MAG: DUF4091 domain-containing protein, partial [Clostridia bacterium]|nr:DUF4091 domain-containing protein [Clostridia bacterium]
SALLGERVSFQICFKSEKHWARHTYRVSVESELSKYITLRNVENVPCDLPGYVEEFDDDYITMDACMMPDVLVPNESGTVEAVYEAWRSLWVTIEPDEELVAGVYPVKIIFSGDDGQFEKIFTVRYINAVLPEQRLAFTQWFHGDCIATYYGLEMFCEEHWKRLEDFIKTAVHGGINTILTPVFTPPLDTAVGGERPTIQLVDMSFIGGKWSFEFNKLDRFIDICLKHGVKHFEIAHLFTQWGAYFTPKIVATTEKGLERIFGWDVSSKSKEYAEFIDAFLPALIDHFKSRGIDDMLMFHVSDEPTDQHIESYSYCKNLVAKHLSGYRIMDALTHYEFYENKLVEHPVAGTDHIMPFIEKNTPDLWAYYCCSQKKDYLSNRFIAQNSYRNRIIATQLFKYSINGFLQWGYNFYYSQCSIRPIDPYRETAANMAFPSGDAFSVYPTKDGVAESLRFVVFHEALQDLRAFELLASLTSKEEVIKLIEKTAGMTVDFNNYPRNAEYILKLREVINAEIEKRI